MNYLLFESFFYDIKKNVYKKTLIWKKLILLILRDFLNIIPSIYFVVFTDLMDLWPFVINLLQSPLPAVIVFQSTLLPVALMMPYYSIFDDALLHHFPIISLVNLFFLVSLYLKLNAGLMLIFISTFPTCPSHLSVSL